MPRRSVPAAGIAAGIVLLLACPAFLDLFWMRIVTFALMFAALSSALNITAGLTGYPAFGDVVWFGIGAYVTGALMVRAHWPFAAAIPVACLFCTTIALLVGPSLLRLRGNYFAIGTLALNEATRALVQNLDVTGGPNGFSLPITSGSVESTARFFYYLFFAATAVAVVATVLLLRTRLGYGLRALRVGEDAADALGVNTTLLKTLAWTVSATLIGLTGAIYAYWITFIEPPAVFDIGISIKMFVIVLLGGTGTLLGPVVGAFGIQLLETEVWGNFLQYHLMILGAIVIAIALFLPGGLVTFVRSRGSALVSMLGGRSTLADPMGPR
jgi:branched-chain amino acid transport system permease protein